MNEMLLQGHNLRLLDEAGLRGLPAILFISRDTCSNNIAKLFYACFCGVSHDYRVMRYKMGNRTDVPV